MGLFFLIWLSLALGSGAVGWGVSRVTIYSLLSSGVFRGKESLNRIELSRLVQDLLKFGDLGSLQLLGGGQMGGGHLEAWGCGHTCAHAHACTHMHTHICIEIANGHPHNLILFEDLKSVETPPPMGGCMVWWVDGWVGLGGVRSNH